MSKYLVSQVERWGEELDDLRPPDPGSRKVGKREAVLLLARKLQSAAKRGFTTAELLAVLAEKGLAVHVDLLREALRSEAGGRTTAGRGGRRKGAAPGKGERRKEEAGNGPAETTEADAGPGGSQPAETPEAMTEVEPELNLEPTRAGGRDAEGRSAAGPQEAAPEEPRRPDRRAVGIDAGLGAETDTTPSGARAAAGQGSGATAPLDGDPAPGRVRDGGKATPGPAVTTGGGLPGSGPRPSAPTATEPTSPTGPRTAGTTPAQPAPRGSFTPRDDSDQL
jgi:hypothetical protein